MREARSPCPIASSLEIFGDRWTLVVLRDMATGKARFAEFLDSPERITSNILADRLGQLERAGLVRKIRYQDNPPRHEYRFTPRGADVLPILQAICAWGNKHLPGTWAAPPTFMRMAAADLLALN